MMFWRRVKAPDVALLTDDIAVGSQPDLRELRALREMGFLGIVDLRDEATDAGDTVRNEGLNYIRIPIVEGSAPGIDALCEVTEWIGDHITACGPVLVHCREGRGRSAMVAVAALVRLGLPLSDAYGILMRARPTAVLTARQMRALEDFSQSQESIKAV